jgi:hypothetical protein
VLTSPEVAPGSTLYAAGSAQHKALARLAGLLGAVAGAVAARTRPGVSLGTE